ncbi:MAG TPA: hypothetical protein V6D29_18780 [Leptolyngbyaceae cyanobacterium]
MAQLNPQEIQALGQSLRRIDSGLMKGGDEETGQRIWYQGGEPYFDVVLETACQDASDAPECINWCQFTLRGKVLLWRRDPARLQTGETEEMDIPPMLAYYAASKTIRDGASLNRAFVDSVTAILQSRPDDPLLLQMGEILAGHA